MRHVNYPPPSFSPQKSRGKKKVATTQTNISIFLPPFHGFPIFRAVSSRIPFLYQFFSLRVRMKLLSNDAQLLSRVCLCKANDIRLRSTCWHARGGEKRSIYIYIALHIYMYEDASAYLRFLLLPSHAVPKKGEITLLSLSDAWTRHPALDVNSLPD